MIFSAADLRQKNKEELAVLLGDERERVARLRMKLRTAPSPNTKEIREVRKNIARIMTMLHQLTTPL